jgi:hypothetical protein
MLVGLQRTSSAPRRQASCGEPSLAEDKRAEKEAAVISLGINSSEVHISSLVSISQFRPKSGLIRVFWLLGTRIAQEGQWEARFEAQGSSSIP